MLPNRLRKPVELKEDDIMEYETFRQVIESFEDRWNAIINMLLTYESGAKSYDDTIPPLKRIMSVLGQEMDRVSTREIAQYRPKRGGLPNAPDPKEWV